MRILLAVLLAGMAANAASAEPQTYHGLKLEIAGRADCKRSELRTTTAFRCEKDQTLWYFTKANNPAHPGVVKRYFVSEPAGGVIREQVWSADPQNPAFVHWRESLAVLDGK